MRSYHLIAAVVLATVATTASAAVYTSEAAYLAADPRRQFVSFSGKTDELADAPAVTKIGSFTLTTDYPTFVSTNFWGSVDSYLDNRFNGAVTILTRPRAAVGFYYATSYTGDTPIDITVSTRNRAVYHGTLSGGGVDTRFAYFGIDGVGAIRSIVLDAGPYANSFVSVANISAGAAVPEPATWLLLAGGFGLVGARLRRRAAAAA